MIPGIEPIETVEMHTGGEPVRIVVSGYPPLQGRTLLARVLLGHAIEQDHGQPSVAGVGGWSGASTGVQNRVIGQSRHTPGDYWAAAFLRHRIPDSTKASIQLS